MGTLEITIIVLFGVALLGGLAMALLPTQDSLGHPPSQDTESVHIFTPEPLEERSAAPVDPIQVLAKRIGRELVSMTPQQIHADLSERSRPGASLATSKAVGVNQKTVQVMESTHEVNMTSARSANELMDAALEFGRKKQDLELLPREMDLKKARIDADISEQELRQGESKARLKELENPKPAPLPDKSKPEEVKSPTERLIARVRDDLEKRGPIARSEARRQLDAEAHEKFKGDKEGYLAYMEAVDRSLAEETRPKS